MAGEGVKGSRSAFRVPSSAFSTRFSAQSRHFGAIQVPVAVSRNAERGTYSTRTLSRISASVAGPIPGTRTRLSTDGKGPNFWRKATIRPASAGPTFGSRSRSAAVAVFRLGIGGELRVPSSEVPAAGAGVSSGLPVTTGVPTAENRTWSRIAASRPGPTPGTRSTATRDPKGPRAFRSDTMALARRSPMRGRRAISRAGARSRSTRSPGAKGRARARLESRCASGALPPGVGSRETCPGGVPGAVIHMRSPCPATASPSSRRMARRSAGMGATVGRARDTSGAGKTRVVAKRVVESSGRSGVGR